MATLHPPTPDPGTPASERRVFEILRDRLPDDWTVLHSRSFLVRPPGNDRATEGEVDFVVLDPTRGFLAVEVKGGRVGRDADGWYSVDGQGRDHRINDPGRQASAGAHAIDTYLQENRWFKQARCRLRFAWCVVFPDVTTPADLGPNLPKATVIDCDALEQPAKALRAAFDHVAAGEPVTPAAQRAFLHALAPTLELVPSLATRLKQESPQLVRLTQEQQLVLDILQDSPRVAVRGGAGTGKTLLAMEKAARLARDGRRTLLLCYNRALADFLAERAEGFEVDTFHRLCSRLARAARLPFQPPENPVQARTFWDDVAPQTLQAALETLPQERWDAVVIDEGQDFQEYWWLAIEQLLRNSEAGTLYVFYDPNQDLFGGDPATPLRLAPARLTVNCRNTRNIAAHSYGLIGQQASIRETAPVGVDVATATCADEAAMLQQVRKHLHRLIADEKVPSDRVLVLSPYSERRSAVWKTRRFGNLQLVRFDELPNASQARFATVQRFKGLEADVVLLCEVKPDSEGCTAQHLYVATSRARHVLVVLRYAGVEG